MYEVLTAVFGLLVLFCIWKKKISDPRTMFFVWLLCFFCCLASCILNRLYGNEMLSMSLIGWMIAILFLSQTFYEIRDNSKCCQQVPAEYTGYQTNYGGRHRFYVPVFSYLPAYVPCRAGGFLSFRGRTCGKGDRHGCPLPIHAFKA